MSRKRPAPDPIDLTGDDDFDPPAHSTATPRQKVQKHAHDRAQDSGYQSFASSAYAGSSQATPLLIDDEEDGSEEVEATQGGASGEEYGWGLYGVLPTMIVGVRFYNGVATVGEMVILRREPNNRYDSNAIQVINVQGQQIGHIPRGPASKLARFMDNRTLLLEGIITGPKGSFDCPIEVKVYGTDEPAARDQLIEQMRADKLPIGHAVDRRRKQQKADKERQKLAAQAAKAAQRNGGAVVGVGGSQFDLSDSQFAAGSSQGTALNPFTLDDIIEGSERINPRNVEEVVERFGVSEEDLAAMPVAPLPDALLTQLHPFQLQGLQWMLDKESPKLPAAGTKDVVQLWRRHATMPNTFTNLATNFTQKDPPLSSGGILADDMGLGKTIQVISLIMADRALGRRDPGFDDATLILAPVSVMSNWSTQMARHVKKEHALRIMFYHGTRKQPLTPKEIQKYDVVISTYDTVSAEWHAQKTPSLNRKSGVFSIKWRRVVLDEGHNIRNHEAKRTVAACNLQAQSRWALTGTPIINNLKDLYSLVRFLQPQGILKELQIFNGAIIRPVLAGEDNGTKILQLLMSGICLRRKKEMMFIDLRLPELSEYVHKLKLLPHEQEKYDALEAQAKGTLAIYRAKLGGPNSANETYRHLLEVLLRMRQLCNHWKLISEERLESVMKQLEAEGVLDLTEENKSALQKLLQLSIDSQEDCAICLDTYRDPVITKCAHVYCTPCLERVIDTQHKCPMCRAELDSLLSTTVKPAKETAAKQEPTQEQLADKDSLEKEASSKVTTVLDILQASAKDPTNKTVIFSQWTTFLDLLQPHLDAAGFTYTRIDGSMTALQRDVSLETFDNDASTTIMLASLSVASVGLNLTVANQVILSDSWWAPAIEDQAVDRVHRLGQKRETRVFRLVVEGSVEERVLGIQADKRKLMGAAFGEKDGGRRGKKRSGAGLADLERLLNGGSGSGTGSGEGGRQNGEHGERSTESNGA